MCERESMRQSKLRDRKKNELESERGRERKSETEREREREREIKSLCAHVIERERDRGKERESNTHGSRSCGAGGSEGRTSQHFPTFQTLLETWCGIWGLRLKVQGLGIPLPHPEHYPQEFGFRVWLVGCRVSGLGSGASGVGSDLGFGLQV